MIITKYELKILKYVCSKKIVSYRQLQKKFRKYQNILSTLDSMVYHHYLVQIGGYQNNHGEPIPITLETMFTISALGTSEVESTQWFNLSFILTSLIIPIIVGVSSSVITAVILSLLG